MIALRRARTHGGSKCHATGHQRTRMTSCLPRSSRCAGGERSLGCQRSSPMNRDRLIDRRSRRVSLASAQFGSRRPSCRDVEHQSPSGRPGQGPRKARAPRVGGVAWLALSRCSWLPLQPAPSASARPRGLRGARRWQAFRRARMQAVAMPPGDTGHVRRAATRSRRDPRALVRPPTSQRGPPRFDAQARTAPQPRPLHPRLRPSRQPRRPTTPRLRSSPRHTSSGSNGRRSEADQAVERSSSS